MDSMSASEGLLSLCGLQRTKVREFSYRQLFGQLITYAFACPEYPPTRAPTRNCRASSPMPCIGHSHRWPCCTNIRGSSKLTSNCPEFTGISYASALKGSSTTPCTNVPIACELCIQPTNSKIVPAVWRYNLLDHVRLTHPGHTRLHISLLRSGSSWTFPPKNKSQWESLKNRSRPPHLIHHHYMKLARLVDSSVVGPITNHPSGEKSQHVRIKLPFVYVSLLVCIRFCAHPALTYLWTWPLSYMLWPYLGH